MKVSPNKVFAPITLLIENEEEAKVLYSLLTTGFETTAFRNATPDVKDGLKALRGLVGEHV